MKPMNKEKIRKILNAYCFNDFSVSQEVKFNKAVSSLMALYQPQEDKPKLDDKFRDKLMVILHSKHTTYPDETRATRDWEMPGLANQIESLITKELSKPLPVEEDKECEHRLNSNAVEYSEGSFWVYCSECKDDICVGHSGIPERLIRFSEPAPHNKIEPLPYGRTKLERTDKINEIIDFLNKGVS